MKLYKISLRFSLGSVEWSRRDADLQGFLIQKNPADETVEGYLNPSATCFDFRAVRGFLIKDVKKTSLIFVAVNLYETPICISFPNGIEEIGYWSVYKNGSFFPRKSNYCANGKVVCSLEDISSHESVEYLKMLTKRNYEETAKSLKSPKKEILDNYFLWRYLFEDEEITFAMQLHFGK